MAGTGEASLERLRDFVAKGPTVVAAITRKAGSTPRDRGAWLIVSPERFVGTIGGGEAERRTVEAARRMLQDGAATLTLDLPLGPALDQCCGGHLIVALKRIETPPEGPFTIEEDGPLLTDPPRRSISVYGAGHVGQALVRALAPLPFDVTWIDARHESAFPVDGPIPCRRIALPETVAVEAPDDAFHLVMTHSHAVDLEIVAAVLGRPFGFLGLIGSASKKAAFLHRLHERGLDTSRLVCPIGLDIPGKEPAVIAASVAAQLLKVDRGC
ncbi:xanthine dehydrogenase accessory protein XdhC [Acuticoccus sediminis]|uniref:Xanthine dehydrogenase accessory protein XdhC n=1 Tax=Acuticoccus sediminis TaxID=2184697 RepID=A0A8B2P3X7_9HYPH|nr:xanthine dehydrogenase accessory protein XdhC [Acuticoccus sediminis]RAI03279.1 xanthine dehydrogenase accessory protein XdhC [Acuticoccus sediminis]